MRPGRDILEELEAERRRRRQPPPEVPGVPGLVVRHAASGFVGTVASIDRIGVRLRGDGGIQREFRLHPGAFVVDGRRVSLVRPAPGAGATPSRPPATTASGSLAVRHRAKVARAGRLLVEGVHDAELLERVWGDELRELAVVVERLDGIDHLAEAVRAFGPAPGRRLGVLVDHLVPGSKEWRLAEAVAGPHVLVTGTPFVDVWQAVRPHVAGIERWPEVPRGVAWKDGVCAALGVADPAAFWGRLLASVRTFADLESEFVGAVERLLDFVTDDDG